VENDSPISVTIDSTLSIVRMEVKLGKYILALFNGTVYIYWTYNG